MTLNGAIMELVELSEHPRMPVIFRPAIQKVIETISELEEKPEPHWIPVTEKPIPKGLVLVTYNDGDVNLLRQPTAYRRGDIVAWCNLPEPYKGGDGMRTCFYCKWYSPNLCFCYYYFKGKNWKDMCKEFKGVTE